MNQWCALLLALLVALGATAQVSLSGIVTDGKAPISGATVVCQQTQQGTVAAHDGWFVLDCNATFPLHIMVRSVGFVTDTILIENDEHSHELFIVLCEAQNEMTDVEIVGTRRSAGFESLDASQALKTVDAAGGIEAVVKTQMGVSSNSELSSQYRVRGGNFDENMVYVNGIEIYRPFLIRAGEQEGLSFVNPDMVGQLTFSSGGFDASYGDRMSSVLDVEYKTPRAAAGSARVSLLGASAHAEGAIGSSATHITGVRYKTNKYLLGSLNTKGDYNPEFFDLQSYWSFQLSPSFRLGVLAYYASNKYEFEPQTRETSFGTLSDTKKLTIYFEGREDDRYQTGIAAAVLDFSPSDQNKFQLSASAYRSGENERYDILGEYWLQQAEQASSADVVNQSEGIGVGGYRQHARNELIGGIYTAAIGGNHQAASGLIAWQVKAQREEFSNYVDEWEQRDSAGYTILPNTGKVDYSHLAKADNKHETSRLQTYLMRERTFALTNGRLAVNYGIRVSYLSGNEEWLASPRAALRFSSNNSVVRFSAGRYCQSPLFRELQRTDGSLNASVEAQNSWQVLAGYDHFFSLGNMPFKFTAEAYYKWLTKLNSYSIDNVRIRYAANNLASGYAWGADLKVNGELYEGVESWASLSVLRTEEDIEGDGAGYVPRPSDQRLSFSMYVQDHMPSNKSIGATLNFYMATGLPFGPPSQPRYKATSRMPGYKRVDMGLYKDFALRPDGSRKREPLRSAKLAVEVFNLFDFQNTISYFWVDGFDQRTYAVPNYLTARRINLKLSVEL